MKLAFLERAWTIAAVVLLLIAALFLLRENYNAAFVAAALGAVAWFLNYRSQLRSTISEPSEIGEENATNSDIEDEE